MAAATVLYQDMETSTEHAQPEGDALWVTLPEWRVTIGLEPG
ncbi:MAG: hypothetical protein ACREOM_01535 [Candidatus Dormibacteraceae bacterium]